MNEHATYSLEEMEKTVVNLAATLSVLAQQEPTTEEQCQRYASEMPLVLGMLAEMATKVSAPFVDGAVTMVDPLQNQKAS